VYIQVFGGALYVADPSLTYLNKAIELKVPLIKGDSGGSGKDLWLLKRSVYTVTPLGEAS
jgi:hypothetical protein